MTDVLVEIFAVDGLMFKAVIEEDLETCTSIDLYAMYSSDRNADLKFAEADIDHEDKMIHLTLEDEKVDRYNYEFWWDRPEQFARELTEHSLA